MKFMVKILHGKNTVTAPTEYFKHNMKRYNTCIVNKLTLRTQTPCGVNVIENNLELREEHGRKKLAHNSPEKKILLLPLYVLPYLYSLPQYITVCSGQTLQNPT